MKTPQIKARPFFLGCLIQFLTILFTAALHCSWATEIPLPLFTNWYAFLTPFTITNGFVGGMNTLEFIVTNGGGSSPTGLRVSEIRGTAVDPNKPPLSIRISEVELCWPAATCKTYQVQYRSQLTTNHWTNLGAPIPGTSASAMPLRRSNDFTGWK